ncbi:hypothetical protein Mro03_50430 [Microbispora rosea subsp. rosea]|nr:hypothetical protein Mro03_50430 [Microbispora rosea subsp. rosea]
MRWFFRLIGLLRLSLGPAGLPRTVTAVTTTASILPPVRVGAPAGVGAGIRGTADFSPAVDKACFPYIVSR